MAVPEFNTPPGNTPEFSTPLFDKVVTRGGDDGRTSLYSGERLFKDTPTVHVLGEIDELSSLLGVVKAELPPHQDAGAQHIHEVQVDLYRMMSLVATSPTAPEYVTLTPITAAQINRLETLIAALMSTTAIAPQFVIPGANRPAAYTDLARAVTRRCERALVGLIREAGRTDLIAAQRYLNRLSDYLFVLARALAS